VRSSSIRAGVEAGGDNIEPGGRYQRRVMADEGNFPASGGGRQYGRDGGYTIPVVAVLLAVSSVGYLFCGGGGGCYSWILKGGGGGISQGRCDAVDGGAEGGESFITEC